jgi:hypothetical protein
MTEVHGNKIPLMDAVVALHLSNMALPADVQNPIVSISFGWGQEDTTVKIETKSRVEAIHSMERDSWKVLPELEHKIYTPGRHGYGVRGNPDNPEEKACLEDSVTQVLDWFARWL